MTTMRQANVNVMEKSNEGWIGNENEMFAHQKRSQNKNFFFFAISISINSYQSLLRIYQISSTPIVIRLQTHTYQSRFVGWKIVNLPGVDPVWKPSVWKL